MKTYILHRVEGLPKTFPQVHTVEPDVRLSPDEWVRHHLLANAIRINFHKPQTVTNR